MKEVNPFLEKRALPLSKFVPIKCTVTPYDKNTASPYTKTRAILLNGAEFESAWFLHQFSRHCKDNDLRREIAFVRRHEQQQQKLLSGLKPINESNLETTISYEQLAVDLTAILAQRANNPNLKNALDFALLEDFDHLYRFANLLEIEQGISSKNITKDYTEIMPGRPTVSEPRHPFDSINYHISSHEDGLFERLACNIITAAEQQTMNYYMNVGQLHPTALGRKLYAEIAMIEEQHVTEYGSLIDPNCSWLENWLMHEYTECYLYYSAFEDETDPKIKALYEQFYLQECGHLQYVALLLEREQGMTYLALFPEGGAFPEPLRFGGNIEYIRKVIEKTIRNTKVREGYCKVDELKKPSIFKKYNSMICQNGKNNPSHIVIENHIKKFGKDYRFEAASYPIKELASRTEDNTNFAR